LILTINQFLIRYNMKKIIYLVAVLLTGLTSFSCSDDYLEVRPDDRLDEQQVFERFNRVDGLVTKLYENAKNANRPLVFFNHFSASAITDECEGSNVEGGLTNKFNDGAWSPDGMPQNSDNGQYWSSLWSYVRRANVVIDGVKRYNTPDDLENLGSLENRVGEAIFFRAYYHFLLLRAYGEIPYLNYAGDPQNVPVFQKESVHTIIDKICEDCDSAYNHVPEKLANSVQFGRIEKGMCLGLKAIVRWMGATPMYNGGPYPTASDTRIFSSEYTTYDASRWEAARDAASDVINFQVNGTKRYSLYLGNDTTFVNDKGKDENNAHVRKRLWNMFYDMPSFQQEWVFFSTNDKWDAWQGDVYPPSAKGASRQMPVQEQVDEYEFIAADGYGYPVYDVNAQANGYDDGNPYEGVKRDPRFYRDIMYHGTTFKNKVINTAKGSDKIGSPNASKTGYYLRKFLKEGWSSDYNFSIHGPAIWRLPEFYFIYAEAVNILNQGPTGEIYDLLNEVRDRSFMAPIPPNLNQVQFNEYIQRERRVELFYENNRVWATRLYLDASNPVEIAKEAVWNAASAEQKTTISQENWPYPKTQRRINGMRPVEDVNGKISITTVVSGVSTTKTYRMERFWVEDRVFNAPRHYLFPIMNDELKRLPKEFPQNPGW